MAIRRGGVLLRPCNQAMGRAEPCPYETTIILHNHVIHVLDKSVFTNQTGQILKQNNLYTLL